MALLKPGYWQTTYFPSQYWQEDYWPEYGTGIPPVAPSAPVGYVKRRKPFPETPEDVGLLIVLISNLRRNRQDADDNG